MPDDVPRHAYALDYDDPLLAELYDQTETQTDDVALLRRLIGDDTGLSVLECFSGTGRILVPLALDGHHVTGLEMAPSMLERARAKLVAAGGDAIQRAELKLTDVLEGEWGSGHDLVVLGCNCFYELPTAAMQEECIRLAEGSLKAGGRVYVDNDNYRGDWGTSGERIVLEGSGADGTYGRLTMEGVAFDQTTATFEMKRVWLARTRNGVVTRREYFCSKHPASGREVEGWLVGHGFEIVHAFGDATGDPYTEDSPRAIFWAVKRGA